MTHRLYVTWGGHRAGSRPKRRKTFPGLQKQEWAYGGGALMERDHALAIAAEMRGRGHKTRVVDAEGVEVVIVPKLHPLFFPIMGQMPKAPKSRKASQSSSVQLKLIGGAA